MLHCLADSKPITLPLAKQIFFIRHVALQQKHVVMLPLYMHAVPRHSHQNTAHSCVLRQCYHKHGMSVFDLGSLVYDLASH